MSVLSRTKLRETKKTTKPVPNFTATEQRPDHLPSAIYIKKKHVKAASRKVI